MKFSEKLQNLRKESKMSQEELASLLDVSRQSVSKWESGQTYPEMDKLLSICKIFRCTLDELTNDEIKDVSQGTKAKNSIIDEIHITVEKTIIMFKSMSYRQLLVTFSELIILIGILLLMHIPIDYINHLGYEIFINFGKSAGNILSSTWNLILEIAYIVLFVIIFFYIYKTRFLEKEYPKKAIQKSKNNLPDSIEKETTEQDTKETKEEMTTIIEKPSPKFSEHKKPSQILRLLSSAFSLIIKLFIFCIGLPFTFMFIILVSLFVISILLLFKGVIYIGIIILIMASCLFTFLLIELVFNIIFDKKTNITRIFIILVTSLIGLGVGFGITMLEISKTTYYNEAPPSIEKKSETREYEMINNLVIYPGYINDSTINYIIDETLTKTFKVELEYYSNYIIPELSISNSIPRGDDTQYLYIWEEYDELSMSIKILKTLIENLSENKIYNYSKLYEYKINIYASSKNIEQFKKNLTHYYEKLVEHSLQENINYYERKINEYETQIGELERENHTLTGDNALLNEQLIEYKEKLQEYKDRINELLEN